MKNNVYIQNISQHGETGASYLKNKKVYLKKFRVLTLISAISILGACVTTPEPEPEPIPVVVEEPAPVILSALPLEDVTEIDIKFAQSALKELGFAVVHIDGIWGPRSSNAIRDFEKAFFLESANGKLSELNLTRLAEMTTIKREQILSEISKNKSRATSNTVNQTTNDTVKTSKIADKLDPNTPLSEAPQLIITDETYAILAKPNPFSQVLTRLPAGEGLYIINLQQGWYQVESLGRTKGYIQE